MTTTMARAGGAAVGRQQRTRPRVTGEDAARRDGGRARGPSRLCASGTTSVPSDYPGRSRRDDSGERTATRAAAQPSHARRRKTKRTIEMLRTWPLSATMAWPSLTPDAVAEPPGCGTKRNVTWHGDSTRLAAGGPAADGTSHPTETRLRARRLSRVRGKA